MAIEVATASKTANGPANVPSGHKELLRLGNGTFPANYDQNVSHRVCNPHNNLFVHRVLLSVAPEVEILLSKYKFSINLSKDDPAFSRRVHKTNQQKHCLAYRSAKLQKNQLQF